MGLNLEISLDRDIREINDFFKDLKFEVITTAARQGLNRAATRTRSLAIKELRKSRKIKLSDLKGGRGKRGFVTVSKARGRNITSLEARVDFSGMPLPLILFILGKKTPKRHFTRNRRRRSRRFEIVKGKKKAKEGLFIQKAKSGTRRFQVFRRVDPSDRSKGYKLQSAPSIAELLRRKSNMLRKIENRALAVMQIEFDRALKFQLSKLKL